MSSKSPPISVIIPTLNAADSLAQSLAPLVQPMVDGLIRDVIIVDGGSKDGTPEQAEAAGCRLFYREASRGGQLALGAEKAEAPWLLFLHADAILSPAAWPEIIDHCQNKSGEGAYFRFKLDDQGFAPRLVEWGVMIRTIIFALPYGDQGLLISRALYEEVGGYADLPLMEDVDLIRRLGRHRLKRLGSPVVSGAARYQSGYVRRIWRNALCLLLYAFGKSPESIRSFYEGTKP